MSDPKAGRTNTRSEPQSFRARELRVSLTVKDLERSLQWYVDVVGFVVDRRHERAGRLVAVSLKAGNVAILLGQDDGAKGWDRRKGEGLTLRFTTEQNIDALAARIAASGGVLESESGGAPRSHRSFRISDPDGFKLAFSS